MNKKQEASLGRHRSVVAIGDKYKDLLMAKPAVWKTYDTYRQYVLDIIANGVVQQSIGTGGADKQKAAEALASGAAEIAGLLYNLFDDTKNLTLRKLVDYSRSDLLELRDEDRSLVCKTILNLAADHKTAAADYGLTAEMLAGADAAYKLYDEGTVDPKLAKGKRKEVTGVLTELFSKADTMLKEKLPKLFKPFEKTAPEFWTEFANAAKLYKARSAAKE